MGMRVAHDPRPAAARLVAAAGYTPAEVLEALEARVSAKWLYDSGIAALLDPED